MIGTILVWIAAIGLVAWFVLSGRKDKPASVETDWTKAVAGPAKPDSKAAISLVRSLEDWFTANGMTTTDARTLLDPVADKIGAAK